MENSTPNYSWGLSPSDLKIGDTIFMIKLRHYNFLSPNPDGHCQGMKAVQATIRHIRTIGGHYLIETNQGHLHLTNADSGHVSIITQS